jgi:L-2,4-diaminobutyrate decarboxylase
MSTEPLAAAFEEPQGLEQIQALLLEMLTGIFWPQHAFVPGPHPAELDLSLNQAEGLPLLEVLAEVSDKVLAHGINSRHTLSLAHMVPPPATVSVIADLLIGAANQCAFIWEEAPLAAAIEAEVIRWMAHKVGFGPHAGGLLTSGGTMSNYIATYLALQRAKLRTGQTGATKYCIIASDQAHLSVDKAAALCGLGAGAVIRVPTNAQGRLEPGQIGRVANEAREAGCTPCLFVCTAGTTNTGALEPLGEFLAAAREHSAWCHLDAAHGGLMCLSKEAWPTVAQWPEADSVSWDPHKSLYVSYAVGTLLVQDETVLAPLDFHGEYALKKDERSDAGARHLEGSRRFEALKLWMTIKYFGTVGFTNLTEHTLSLARELAAQIRGSGDFELVTLPDTNIVCFRFVDPTLSLAVLDKVNAAVQKALFQNGGPLISSTRIAGRTVLRSVLLNPRLASSDLVGLLDMIRCEAQRQVSFMSMSRPVEFEEISDEVVARH